VFVFGLQIFNSAAEFLRCRQGHGLAKLPLQLGELCLKAADEVSVRSHVAGKLMFGSFQVAAGRKDASFLLLETSGDVSGLKAVEALRQSLQSPAQLFHAVLEAV